jgi:hypothetical protein
LRDKREEEISVRAIPQTPYDKNSCSSFGFGCTKRKALLLTGSTKYLLIEYSGSIKFFWLPWS